MSYCGRLAYSYLRTTPIWVAAADDSDYTTHNSGGLVH